MAKRRKTTLAGTLVSEATKTLPAPAAYALSSPSRFVMAAVVVGGLVYAGVFHVEWKDGRPSLVVDKARATELREEAVEEARHLRDEWQENAGQREPLWSGSRPFEDRDRR